MNQERKAPQDISDLDALDVARRAISILETLDSRVATFARELQRPLLPGGYDVIRQSQWVSALTAVGTGVARGTVSDNIEPGHIWLIDRIGTFVTSGSYAQALITIGDPQRGEVVDVSRQSPDIADQAQPIVVGAGSLLWVEATGMTANAQVVVTVQYRLARMARDLT